MASPFDWQAEFAKAKQARCLHAEDGSNQMRIDYI
jgi:hypothetical protein